jgi:cytoskeleton protein RodZ
MLRQARQAQGLHIVALAAAIKVTPRKLEMLEADRFDELLDVTFARALAKAVCRVLHIDAGPVLARLPQLPEHGLDRVASSMNTPFRERPAHTEGRTWTLLKKPSVWGPVLILVGAAAVWLLPKGVWTMSRPAKPATQASAPAAVAPAPVVETVHSAPLEPTAAGPAIAASALSVEAQSPAAGSLTFRTSGESWVEVLDAKGQPLLSRMLQRGETVGLDGLPPLRVTVGNAAVTQIDFRGQHVDLAKSARDNVARLELR